MLTEEEIKALQTENATLKSSVDTLTSDTTAMKTKMDQLLTETKTAKTAAKAADDEKTAAIAAQALKDGNFEELYKASQESGKSLQEKHDGLLNTIATKDRSSLASKIAGQLADGTNAELLSTFIQPRLKSTDDGIKILDSNGGLTVLSADDLATEFKGDARYASLLKGNQSSGGGANGGNPSGGAAQKTMLRSDFDQLNPTQRMEHIKAGGKTTDD